MKIKFSIIVPIYNGETVIERCIQSVLQQEFDDWELILVNDGSTDGTREICERYLLDSRVRLINQRNKGVSFSRNTGIAEAQGEYILFVDADDYLNRNTCVIFERIMEQSNCDFCIASYDQILTSGVKKTIGMNSSFKEGLYFVDCFADIFKELYAENLFNSPWAKCFRKELITTYFDVNLSLGEDLVFNLNYLSNCKDVYVTKKTLYNYEIQESGSLSSRFLKDGFQMLNKVYDETLVLSSIMFSEMGNVKNVIDKKYVVDFINMFERNVRLTNGCFGASDLKNIYDTYSLQPIFLNVIVDKYGIKYEIERKLLCKHFYKIFCGFTLFLFKIKSLWRKIRGFVYVTVS